MKTPITVRHVYTYEVVAEQDVWWNLRTLLERGVDPDTLHRLDLRGLLKELRDMLKDREDIVFEQQARGAFKSAAPSGRPTP